MPLSTFAHQVWAHASASTVAQRNTVDTVDDIGQALTTTGAGSEDIGGLDFINVKPTNAGLEVFDIWRTIAGVIMYAGLIIGFLTFLGALIMYGYLGNWLGDRVTEKAKQVILRVCVISMAIGSAGAIWTFFITR